MERKFDVYYQKEMSRDWHIKYSVAKIDQTHVRLFDVEAKGLEDVFCLMQAEEWSKAGEANPFIKSKGLRHTSMMVGDIILDSSDGKWYMVDHFGFKEVPAE